MLGRLQPELPGGRAPLAGAELLEPKTLPIPLPLPLPPPPPAPAPLLHSRAPLPRSPLTMVSFFLPLDCM